MSHRVISVYLGGDLAVLELILLFKISLSCVVIWTLETVIVINCF